MKKFKMITIWSLINGGTEGFHPHHEKENRKKVTDEVLQALFPGIEYYGNKGFLDVINDYLTPTLKKLFPELAGMLADKVNTTDDVVIEKPFLPCPTYDYLKPDWKEKFNQLLIN